MKKVYLTPVMLAILCAILVSNFYPVKLKHSSSKHVFSIRVENNMHLGQIGSSEASHIFKTRKNISGSARQDRLIFAASILRFQNTGKFQ